MPKVPEKAVRPYGSTSVSAEGMQLRQGSVSKASDSWGFWNIMSPQFKLHVLVELAHTTQARFWWSWKPVGRMSAIHNVC